PVAFFVRKMADVPDERFRRGAAPLWIEEVQAGDAQLSAAQWSALHRGLSQSFPAESPLLRSISEKWHALEANEASARALARSAAAQGDTTFAFQVLSERMKSESISPDLANDYLLAFAQQLRTRHSALVRRDWSQEMKAAHQARTLVSGNEKAVGLYQRICELLGESPTSTLK
ncbi:MAG: hypothetical protein ACKVPX_16280, partial [Myxococcaceae bacterium]